MSKKTAGTLQLASSISFGHDCWNATALLTKKSFARSAGLGAPLSGLVFFHAAKASGCFSAHFLTASLCLSSALTHACATAVWSLAHCLTMSFLVLNQASTSGPTSLPWPG